MVKTSVYNANSVADIAATEKWLGRDLDAIQVHGGTSGWNDWLGSVGWQGNLYKGANIDIMWSIPLIPYGANLGDAAAGKYDDKYLAMAKQLVANAAADGDTGQIYVRLGWEFNTSGWNAWGAVGQAANYAEAFRQFVDTARTVSDKFVFEWTPNVGDFGMNPADAYPGDKYVDVIGSDFYYNTQWDSKDAKSAFNWIVNEKYGLQWQQDFASAHGKPTAIGEWGLNSDNPEFVKLVGDWANSHNMVYQNYWDSNAAFQGQLSSGQYPNAAAAFKALYGTGTASAISVPTGSGSGSSTTPVFSPDPGIGGATTGNDVIHGSASNTDLRGGDGNDTYYLTATNQSVTEWYHDGKGGTDTIYSTVTHTMEAGVENMTLTGSANIDGTGNSGNNILTGNAGNNVLTGGGGNDKIYGGAGNDTIYGGAGDDHMEGGAGNDVIYGGGGSDDLVGGDGNDTYYVDNAGQKVYELYSGGKGGTDTVYSSITYKLTDFVEDLHLTGTANLDATGNTLANKIFGNTGDNHIDGGLGNDALTGGGGHDTFVFGLSSGKDIVTDFAAGDTIDLSAYLAAHKIATVAQSGKDTILTIDAANSIRLIGVTPDHVHATSTGYVYG